MSHFQLARDDEAHEHLLLQTIGEVCRVEAVRSDDRKALLAELARMLCRHNNPVMIVAGPEKSQSDCD